MQLHLENIIILVEKYKREANARMEEINHGKITLESF